MALFGPGARPEVAAGPAEALAIEAVGLTVKLYPCCAATHRTLDGFLALRATYGFAAGDVASITAEVSHTHAACLLYPYPEDPAQARFSMPFVLAIALLRGAPTLADFTASSVQDPALRALLGRTRLIGQPQRAIGDANPHAPAVTTVRLRDGRELHAVTQHPQGTLAQPASAQAVAAKFCDCVATLPSDLAGRLELLLSECSASLDLRALTTILSRASPRAMHATSVNHCRPQMRRGA
jgi:2-methylcitrate dehydratase PrpD